MKYFQFRRGAKDDKPSFKFQEETTNKIAGKLKGVFFNEPKTVTTKEGKSVTIPANVNIVFENEQSVSFSVELGGIFRATINSLLSADIGSEVELYCYTNKKGYKTVGVTNPTIKEKKVFDDKEVEVNQSYTWAYTQDQIPEVEVIKNKKGDFVSADDSEANQFLIDAIKIKFGKKDNSSLDISVEDLPF